MTHKLRTIISDALYPILNNHLSSLCAWGIDSETDLTLKVGWVYFTFYKYPNPLIRVHGLTESVDFVPFNTAQSRRVWQRLKKFRSEYYA